jgi:hypothetical protein
MLDNNMNEIVKLLGIVNNKTNASLRASMPESLKNKINNETLNSISGDLDNIDDFVVFEDYVDPSYAYLLDSEKEPTINEDELQQYNEKSCVISPNRLFDRGLVTYNKVKDNTTAIKTLTQLVQQISSKATLIENFNSKQDIILNFLHDLKILRNYANLCVRQVTKKNQRESTGIGKPNKVDEPPHNSNDFRISAMPGGGQSYKQNTKNNKYSEQNNFDNFMKIYNEITKLPYKNVYNEPSFANKIDECVILLEGMKVVNLAPLSNS